MKVVLIPMAGLGSRFSKEGYTVHKPLIEVAGKPLIRYSIDSLGLSDEWNVVIVARDLGGTYMKDVQNAVPEATIIWIDELTTGATHTCLMAESTIDPEDELIITNCDQYLEWNVDEFLEKSREDGVVGSVLTYKSSDPKNSFCRISSGHVTEIVEKEAVSEEALVGVHYWSKGKYFLESAKDQMSRKDKLNETYISETYQYLINSGNKIISVPINGKYWSTGTPEDLGIFKGYYLEYKVSKPQTFFIDLDGTILKHAHRYSNLKNGQELCDGVKDAMDELDSNGHKIIIVSARKESAREKTEEMLWELGIPYDQLILGVSQGCRVMVNDIISNGSERRARAVNVITDNGWNTKDLM